MKKYLSIALVIAMLVSLPSLARADEAKTVSDLCQEAAQAQTSAAMTTTIQDAFKALESEAQADEERIREVTPIPLESVVDKGLSLPQCTITRNGKTMKYLLDVKGEPDESGYPLFIVLHGGGQALPKDNDYEWHAIYEFYRSSIDHGIYVACRGMEDVWNLHSLPDSYAMYDRIIEDMVLLKNADPNRVYLLGFSAGGDGVYEVTPRMADRFAAANMSSGHPNSASLLNLANVPFQIQVGVRDFYSESALRCIKGAAFDKILSDYHDTYGFGYEHRVLVHVPEGHNFNDHSEGSSPDSLVLTDPVAYANRAASENWLNSFVDIYKKYYAATPPTNEYDEDVGINPDSANSLYELISDMSYQIDKDPRMGTTATAYADFCAELTKKITGTDEGEYGLKTDTVDTDAVHYVNQFTRAHCPNELVWDLSMRAAERAVSSFYWLKADKSVDKGLITADFDADTNSFNVYPSDDVSGDFLVLINPHMVDISRPVTFKTPKGDFTINVQADPKVVEASLRETTDPFLAWVQEVSYDQLKDAEGQDEGTSQTDDEPEGSDDGKPDGSDDEPEGADDEPEGADDGKPEGANDDEPEGADDGKPDGSDDGNAPVADSHTAAPAQSTTEPAPRVVRASSAAQTSYSTPASRLPKASDETFAALVPVVALGLLAIVASRFVSVLFGKEA